MGLKYKKKLYICSGKVLFLGICRMPLLYKHRNGISCMKRKLHLIIYVAFIVLLSGCAQQPKKFVIGVSQCSEDIWRDKLNDELKMGEYLNDSLIVKLASSNDDNMLQNKQVNQFIDEGVDLLIISPNQLSAISKAVERAYDKGFVNAAKFLISHF